MNSQDQIIKIQKTANTLYDLRDHSDVKYCKEISDFLIEKSGGNEGSRISTENFSAFVVSRFTTTHRFIELMAQRLGKELQIVELGSGFTPHFLNLNYEIGKYIEIDLEVNSKLKKEITRKLRERDGEIFIAGDILTQDVWNEVGNNIDLSKPVIIFSEGVVAQYFTTEQKEKIASLSRAFLQTNGSCFVVDDTLRNHSELHDNPIIQEGMSRIVAESGSKVYKSETSTFESEIDKWNKLFNNTIYTVDYVPSKPEMDFALRSYKLTVCMNDQNRELESVLLELSKQNKNNRTWK
ncbi:MAG: class I SAM-dependent methyltransferase [Candidatus Taylorbacteria bacterium]